VSSLEEEVGHHVEVVAQREILVDGGDAEHLGIVRFGDRDLLAVEGDDALVSRADAGDRLDEGRLSRAIVADERDDLSWRHGELHPAERLDGAEPLGDPLHLQDGRAGRG